MQSYGKTKYDIITGTRLDKFNEEINERLSQGWMLQGGVNVTAVVSPHDHDRVMYTYVQAMIRTMESDEQK